MADVKWWRPHTCIEQVDDYEVSGIVSEYTLGKWVKHYVFGFEVSSRKYAYINDEWRFICYG